MVDAGVFGSFYIPIYPTDVACVFARISELDEVKLVSFMKTPPGPQPDQLGL